MFLIIWYRDVEIDRRDKRLGSNQFKRLRKLSCTIVAPVVIAKALHVDSHFKHMVLPELLHNLIPHVLSDQSIAFSDNFLT